MPSVNNSAYSLRDDQDKFNREHALPVKKVRVNTDDNVIIESSLDRDDMESLKSDLDQEANNNDISSDISSEEVAGNFRNNDVINDKQEQAPGEEEEDTDSKKEKPHIIRQLSAKRKRSQTLPSNVISEKRNIAFLHSNSFQTLDEGAHDGQVETDNILLDDGSEEAESNRSPSWVLTELLHRIGDKDYPDKLLVKSSNELVTLLGKHKHLRQDLVLQTLVNKLQNLLLKENQLVVASGYRLLRSVIHGHESFRFFRCLNLQFFIVYSLAKDVKNTVERLEAVKLVRKFIDTEGGTELLNLGTVNAIVAVAETPEDPLRNLALETICEVSVLYPEIAYKGQGIRLLVQAVVEGSSSITSLCITALLKLLELPSSRKFVLEEQFIQKLISPFMSIARVKIERLQLLAYAITCTLKTWPGIIAFSKNNFSSLRQLVDCLTADAPAIKVIILHIFFDIFRIRHFPWIAMDGGYLTSNSSVMRLPRTKMMAHPKATYISKDLYEKDVPLVSHFTSLLIYLSFRCGLWDRLTEQFNETKDLKLSKKIVFLMSEMTYLQMNLIPKELEFSVSPSFRLNELLEASIRKYHRRGNTPSSFRQKALSRLRSEVVPTSAVKLLSFTNCKDLETWNVLTQSHMQLEFQKRFSSLDIRMLIIKSHVLDTKNFQKWDWALITLMMKAPLRNAKLFDEVVKTTKFYKRLLSFFRPFKYRFSILRRTAYNQRYVEAGCEIFRSLLSNAAGIQYLSHNKLLPQIAECLAQIDPYSGITANEALFSNRKLETTLSSSFFKFIGILSGDTNGIKMMEQWWMFDMMYHITDASTGREDLVRILLKELQYDMPGHSRVLLDKVASTGSVPCRIQATQILGKLLNRGEGDSNFACRTLVNQLCDTEEKVSNEAIRALTKFAKDEESINMLISYRPSLDGLGRNGQQLMEAIFSTPVGFQYLQSQLNFVETEMEAWTEVKNKVYVAEVEAFIARRLMDTSGEACRIPYHFFGSVSKTVEGIRLLENTGTFSTLVGVVVSYLEILNNDGEEEFYAESNSDDLARSLVELKAAFWAVGHIGSTEYGITLLETAGLTDIIADIALRTKNSSIKGICYFVLGLLSGTDQGAEILDDLGWKTVHSSLGKGAQVCLPKDIERFFQSMPELEGANEGSPEKKVFGKDRSLLKIPPESSTIIFQNIMSEYFIDTSSASGKPSSPLSGNSCPQDYLLIYQIYENLNLVLVSQGKAYRNLNRSKKRHPQLFGSEPAVLRLIFEVLSLYRVKTPVRRYILTELIDFCPMMENLLKLEKRRMKRERVTPSSPAQTLPPLPMPRSTISGSPIPQRLRHHTTPTPVNPDDEKIAPSLISRTPSSNGSGLSTNSVNMPRNRPLFTSIYRGVRRKTFSGLGEKN